MQKNMKFILILFFVTIGCTATYPPGSYYLDTACNLCIVDGEINGKKTHFLVDTGAGITCCDINQSKYFDFTYVDCDIEVGGYNNSSGEVKKAIGVQLKIKDVFVTDDVIYTQNMSNLVRYVEQCSHKKISGIIGVPIIKKYGLVIDLTNNKLYRLTKY